jgi:hypothetical protein
VSYPILKFPEAPDVAIKLIDRPSERPWEAGEPTAAIGAGGDRQCDLQRDRRANEVGTVHTRGGAVGAEGLR